jgi:hypothetical protein
MRSFSIVQASAAAIVFLPAATFAQASLPRGGTFRAGNSYRPTRLSNEPPSAWVRHARADQRRGATSKGFFAL